MRRLLAVFFGILLGGGLVYTAFEYHVVRTEETVHFVPKKQAGLTDPYVDIREWGAAEWKDHAVLAENLVANGQGELITNSISNGFFNDFVSPFLNEPAEQKRDWWKPSEN